MRKLVGKLALLICVCGLWFTTAIEASAGSKIALVLGNAKYQFVPELGNPSNDATDVAQALRNVGFDVIEAKDTTRDQMAAAIRDFSEHLNDADVALFFYAGHGLQINGENYLLPVNTKINSPADVRFNTINLADILQEMEADGGGRRANIIILDACRNNPFLEKLATASRAAPTRGLGRIDATGEGSLVVYATQPNNVALDGAGRNSPFTSALLKHLTAPGLEIRQMISKVRADVLQTTDHHQTPWDSSSLTGDIYLAGNAPPPQTNATTQTAPLTTTAAETTAQQRTGVSPEAAAQPESVKECDRLTAPKELVDPSKTVAVEQVDWSHAVAVCDAALKTNPTEPHLQYALATAYFHTKHYIDAVNHYKIAADGGLPAAESSLGYCYFKGFGVVKNDQKAFELWSKAAEKGWPDAMGNLASAYADGVYVKEDDAKSLDWNEKAIEAGNILALVTAGNSYLNARGVPRDFTMAAQYYQQAADLGNGFALKTLANMYEAGFMGAPQLDKAGALRLRAQQLDPDSSDPSSVDVFRKILQASRAPQKIQHAAAPRRRYVIFRRYRFFGCGWVWC